eukprot:jgi/Picre1/34178/NNA_001652.t1
MQVLSRATASYQALEKDSLIVAPSKSFMSLGYGYLPLVWSSILAYYLELLLVEAGTIVQVAGSSVGIPEHYLPSISADASVVTFLQASTLLLGISSHSFSAGGLPLNHGEFSFHNVYALLVWCRTLASNTTLMDFKMQKIDPWLLRKPE